MKSWPILIIALSVVSSCDWGGMEPENIQPNLRALQVHEKEMVFSNSKFAIDLFHQLQETEHPNQFFSPFSIHQALSMTMNGNEGDVLEEFIQVLRYEGMGEAAINQAAKDLTSFLLKLDPKVDMSIANAIWYKDNYQVFPAFRAIVTDNYQAEMAGLDMHDPQSVPIINNWIENKTQGIIKDMLDFIPENAVMYLVNAIYFKGDWKYQFASSKTKPEPFYVTPLEEKTVDMMQMDEAATFRYWADADLQYLEVPYSTGQFNMGILTGREPDLGHVIASFTFDNLEHWRENAQETNFILKMPKFKMSQKMDNMKVDLIEMGLERPFYFHPDNFTRLFSNPTDDLKISRVIHDAFIEVDEKGTEAAAATVVEVVEKLSMPSGPRTLTLDQPFVFFIQENHSGAILFMGKFSDPGLLE